MIMTHTRAKYQAQKLLGSKATVERDGRADTTDRITLPGNTAGNNTMLPGTAYMAMTRPHAKLLWWCLYADIFCNYAPIRSFSKPRGFRSLEHTRPSSLQ